jgi:hypothetical protein
VFTIFGRDTKPMETVFNLDEFPERCLVKVVFLRSVIAPLRRSLLSHGVTESVVFPDLEGLARETRRVFGFEA